jgi:hypothetical protein
MQLLRHDVAARAQTARRPCVVRQAARRRGDALPEAPHAGRVDSGDPGALIGVGFIVASLFTAPGALTDDGYPLDSFFLLMGAIFSITFPIGPAIVVLFAIRPRPRFDRFMSIGLDETGQVIGAERANLKVNGVPQYELRLRVFAASRPPYEVSVKELVPTMQMHSLMGSNIPIKIDPQDPNSVFVVPR